jgi:Glycosyltransferase family 87
MKFKNLFLPLVLGLTTLASLILRFKANVSSDVNLYEKVSKNLLEGKIPFQNGFYFEYPPLTGYLFAFLKVINNILVNFDIRIIYNSIFIIFMLILFFLNHIYSIKLHKQYNFSVLFLYIATILFVFEYREIAFERYDILPAFLTLIGISYFTSDKYKNIFMSGFLIGLGISIKLYPVLLLPIFLIYLIFKYDEFNLKKFLVSSSIFLIGLITTLIPTFYLLIKGYSGAIKFYQYHSLRGLEITSLGTTFARIGEYFGYGKSSPYAVCCEFGSTDLIYSKTGEIKSFLNVLLIIGFIIILLILLKNIRIKKANKIKLLYKSSFLVILLFIITNKVFSTQYFIWILSLGVISINFISNIRLKIITSIVFIVSMCLNSAMLNYFWYFEKPLSIVQTSIIDIKNVSFIILFILIITNMNFENNSYNLG